MKKLLILLLLNIPILSTTQISNNYCLMDITSNRVISSNNKDTRRLTASIAKIMTAIVAIENGELDNYLTITYEDNIQEGSRVYLETDDKLMLYDALCLLMLRSGNDMAHAISINVAGSVNGFARLMNDTAKKIGMKNSTFENPSGLDTDSYNYSTPYDMALLTSYCYKNDVFREIFEKKQYNFTTINQNHVTAVNKHRLVRSNDIYLGGKTGFTKKAGRTLVTTAKANDTVLVCVTMNEGNDWNVHSYLLHNGLNGYNMTKVMGKQILKPSFKINYLPELKEDIYIPLTDKEERNVEIKVYLKDKPDKTCGYLVVLVNGIEVSRKNLYVAKDNIDTSSLVGYIIKSIYD